MRCGNCNADIDYTMRFCPVCGTKVEGANSIQFQRDQCRQELDAIIPDLKLLEEKYIKAERIGKAQNNLDGEYRWYQIGVGFAVFIFTIPLFVTLKVPEKIVPVVSLFLAIISTLFIRKFLNRLKEHARQKYDDEIDQYTEQYLKYYNNVYPILSKWLPEDYWYSTAVQSIATYFKNNRADSIKEALNLYEEEMYRLRMENMQEKTMRENEKQTAWAALTAFNTSIIALSSLNRD